MKEQCGGEREGCPVRTKRRRRGQRGTLKRLSWGWGEGRIAWLESGH